MFDASMYDQLADWGRQHQSLAVAETKRRGDIKARFLMGLVDAGLKPRMIARVTGMSMPAVYTALHRARKRLAEDTARSTNADS